MPGLVAFGRRWQVGSDDFVFPGLIELLIRLAWLVAVLIAYWRQDSHLNCPGGHLLRVYLIGVLLIIVLIIIATGLLTHHSMKGSIADQEARKHVAKCLYLRVFLVGPEVVWNALGSIWAFSGAVKCQDEPVTVAVVTALIICNWLLFLFLAIFLIVAFDPIGSNHFFASRDEEAPDFFESAEQTHPLHKLWEWRCRLLCCCAGVGQEENTGEAFQYIASVVASIFHDTDLVPSDVAAGLIIANLKEKRRRREKRRSMKQSANSCKSLGSLTNGSHPPATFTPIVELPPSPCPIDSNPLASDVSAWMTPQMAHHFCKFALGCYSWPWYMATHLCTGICRLSGQLACCACFRPKPTFIHDDNCCFCHSAALKNLTGLTDDDLIHVSFRNRVCQVPFYVAVDHQTSSIVVSVRGSLSFRDAITDLMVMSHTLEVSGLPPGCMVHKGIYETAVFVKNKLEETGALNKAFSMYQNYNLVLTGHSLGAGTAAVLAMILQPSYPSIKCFAYSPPCGLLNPVAAQFTESFVLSVVIGDDLVARLSVEGVDTLKQRIIMELSEATLPKYRIIARGCWSCLFGASSAMLENFDNSSQASTPNQNLPLLGTPTSPLPHTYESLSDVGRRLNRQNLSSSKLASFPKRLPGRILHIVEKSPLESRPDMLDTQYEVRWAHQEDFRELTVTPRMVVDHLPDTVINTLRRLVQQYETGFWGDVSS